MLGNGLRATAVWNGKYSDPADSVDNGEEFYCANEDFLSGNGTLEFLTTAFCYCWERPAYATNHLYGTRIPSARIFYSSMGTGTDPTPGTTSNKKKKYNFVIFTARKRLNAWTKKRY